MAVPTIPDSASGVSTTRCSPKSFWRPSVTRNTPPSLPTSSPMIITLGSASSARRIPSLRARERVSLVIAQPPCLELAGQAVPGGIVGGGVRAHPVGERLDQRRALALVRGAQRLLGDRVAGEHVVAVDPDPGEAEAAGPLVQRNPALPLLRHGDRPLVVLAEEHHRGVEDGCEVEGLADIPLACRAVAEVDDHRLIVGAVALDPHRVASGVQRLVADHDRVQVELVFFWIPAAMGDAAEKLQWQRLTLSNRLNRAQGLPG